MGKFEKEDATSPTVATGRIFTPSVIDTRERRDVATIDTPGEFLHVDSDDHSIMVLKGKLTLFMCHVDSKLYRKYNKRGKPVIYAKILKAIYGLPQSALLFYRKLVKDLQKYGLKMKPNDPCVLNSTKNRKTITVKFHVDELKVSRMDPFEITFFLCYLYRIYGNKLVVHKGKEHDYFEINF